jgi:hypothetical protein
MTKFKVGDWIVPKDEHQRQYLKHFEIDVVWPREVLDVEPGFSDDWDFVAYDGCTIHRDSSRFMHHVPLNKSLDDYM